MSAGDAGTDETLRQEKEMIIAGYAKWRSRITRSRRVRKNRSVQVSRQARGVKR